MIYRLIITICCLILAGKGEGAEVLGIGAPIVDLILHVDDDFLQEHAPGYKGGGYRPGWEKFSKILELASDNSPTIATGGSCSNTIKGLASLGVSTALFGKLGNDKMGDFFLEKIVPLGIESLHISCQTPTAQVMCLVTPDKNRTFVVFPGAGDEISPNDLTDQLFEGIRHLHVDGYMLYNGQIVEEAMKRAKANGATVSFDLATFNVVNAYKDHILHLLDNYVDLLFANQDEATALIGLTDEEACEELLALCDTVVILAGADGCIAGSKEGILRQGTAKVDVVDTTGAGDLFASGFIYGYLKGMPLCKCARLGNLLGSTVVTVNGAEIPKHLWEKIENHLTHED